MLNLKLPFLYSKILTNPLKCAICTDVTLQARKKIISRIKQDPGLRHRKSGLEDDPEYLEEFESDDLELADTQEADFSHVDKVFENHVKDYKRKQRRMKLRIESASFFKAAPQPSMLTYNERQHIKHLHKENPLLWNAKTLSESFPATPDIIIKVLNTHWKVPLERQKKMDAAVQKNWELLAEGKLKADPELIDHLKRFVNRREIIAEQLKNSSFYYPEIKEERSWNNGEMSSILTNYEKEIENLEKEHFKELESKKISDGSKNLPSCKEQESDLDTLHNLVEKKKNMIKLKGKESFTLGEMVKTYAKQQTFEDLEEDILHKAEAKKNLNLYERAILDHKLGKTKVTMKDKQKRFLNETVNMELKYSNEENQSVEDDWEEKEAISYIGGYNSNKMGQSCEISNVLPTPIKNMNDQNKISKYGSLDEESTLQKKNLHFEKEKQSTKDNWEEAISYEKDFNSNKMRREINYLKKKYVELSHVQPTLRKNVNDQSTSSEYSFLGEGRTLQEKKLHFEEEKQSSKGNWEEKGAFSYDEDFNSNKMRQEINYLKKKDAELSHVQTMLQKNMSDQNTSSEYSSLDEERTLQFQKIKSIEQENNSNKIVAEEKEDSIGDSILKRGAQSSEKEYKELSEEQKLKDKLYYDKEVDDIRNTPFWNSNRSSGDKKIAEREKRPLGGPIERNKITKADVFSDDIYPERIKIPKNKRGSGLVFKIRDCYYDDDGEFLYRVPGMTK